MVAFDADLWRDRAWQRMERSSDGSTKSHYGRDLIAISAIEKVVSWCKKRNIKVEFTNEPNGTFYKKSTKIEINGRLRPENQLFVLLHECGHYLVYKSDVARGSGNDLVEQERSLVSKVAIISEEFEAWDRGKKLASRLKVYINNERFEQVKARLLNSYFRWATGVL